MAEALETGELQRHVYETLQPSYGQRYRTMVGAIKKFLIPLGVEFPQMDRDVAGGYFIWLMLPQHIKGAEVTRRAKEDENLVLAQGESKTSEHSIGGSMLTDDAVFEVINFAHVNTCVS